MKNRGFRPVPGPDRNIPIRPYGDPFYSDQVQEILDRQFSGELGFPILAYEACEYLATLPSANWSKGDPFLRCYKEDPLWCAELLLAVTKVHLQPKSEWTMERWVANFWHGPSTDAVILGGKEPGIQADPELLFQDSWADVKKPWISWGGLTRRQTKKP